MTSWQLRDLVRSHAEHPQVPDDPFNLAAAAEEFLIGDEAAGRLLPGPVKAVEATEKTSIARKRSCVAVEIDGSFNTIVSRPGFDLETFKKIHE